MRIKDFFRLAKFEFKIGKKECVIALLIQGILLTGIIYIISLFNNIDGIVDGYLHKQNNDGFEFELKNFDESDKEWLYKKGFYELLYSDGKIIYAKTDSIKHIWSKKIYALTKGKDIWNEETDKIIEVILFVKIVMGFLSIILFVLLMTNIINSIDMKMMARNRYKHIIFSVGMKKDDIKGVFIIYFLSRILLVVIFSLLIFGGLNNITNHYINETMKIQSNISFLGMENGITILITCVASFILCSRRIKVGNGI